MLSLTRGGLLAAAASMAVLGQTRAATSEGPDALVWDGKVDYTPWMGNDPTMRSYPSNWGTQGARAARYAKRREAAYAGRRANVRRMQRGD